MSAHKGPRRFVAARLPLDLAERVERAAADAGLTLNDFLTRQLAASLPADTHERGHQTVTAA